MTTYYAVVSKNGTVSKSYKAGTKLYEMKHAADARSRLMKGSRVVYVRLEDLEPVTEDLTEQFTYAERMALKYTVRMEEIQRQMAKE